ncbi:MAG: PIG-L family deacetylase, partial [Bacteroidota bacterium]
MLRLLLLTVVACYFVNLSQLSAQLPHKPTSGEIHAAIQKAQVLGSALYMAAHPDDENTRLIAYLANVDKVETAYLSLTRGDGGQNLIASDIRELLGLTRTQELLAARRTDGGTQFFSRANDFGYSKHPDETFNIWDKQQVLADAVKVIRTWRPDIIVLRFDPRKPGTTHGHHTASAIIGMEAFELAGDPTAFPEQLTTLEPWSPKRIYWNAYTWRRDLAEHIVQENVIKVNVGTFLPKLGESVPEIAARSRSKHKSQGFGSSGSRAAYDEDLELMAGDGKGEKDNPFAGIDLSWKRVAGGEAIGTALARIEEKFQFDDPAASVPDLIAVYRRIQSMPPSFWTEKKGEELADIIADCMGVYLAASAKTATTTPGATIKINLEATNRSQHKVRLLRTMLTPVTQFTANERVDEALELAQPWKKEMEVTIPDNFPNSGPYWLQEAGTLGMYKPSDESLAGLGESPDPISVVFDLGIDDGSGRIETMSYTVPLRYQFTDPVKGEQHQPLEVLEPVFAELSESSYLFTESSPQEIQIKVTAGRAELLGTLELCTPSDWQVSPAKTEIKLHRQGEEAVYTFLLTPPEGQAQGMIVPLVRLEGSEEGYTRKLVTIDHDHIPTQIASLDASVPVSKLDLKRAGQRIGYLMGAGDAIPQALRNIGYDVTLLEDDDFVTGDLQQYDAIIVGIRAYNTLGKMPNYNPKMLAYVKQGGTMIVQYNTSRRLKVDMTEIGPYPLQLSRDRVTVEEAEVRLLAKDHPALNTPNKITEKDFEGWIQERGLYFPNEWDDNYTAILS